MSCGRCRDAWLLVVIESISHLANLDGRVLSLPSCLNEIEKRGLRNLPNVVETHLTGFDVTYQC